MLEREIERVVDELGRLVGVPLTDGWQPARDRFVLGWRDGTLVTMVPRGASARLHSIARRPENPRTPYSFQGACRSRLGGVTRAVRQTPGEREVTFTFDRGALVLRLSGRSGGLWLVDGDEVVASLDGPAPTSLPALPDRPPRPDPPRFAPVDGSWDLGARAWFEAREAEARLAELRERARRALSDRLRREQRLLEHLGGDLERVDEAPTLRRRGELLSAHLWRVPRGAASIDVEDWDSGATATLTWAPGTTASEAAARWFAQAKRLERAGEHLLGRIDALERSIAETRRALDGVAEADEAALRAWVGTAPARAAPSRGTPWREWLGPHGERVRIGWSEAGNRRLLGQVARGHHVWMHLRDRPSAHVVLELAKGASPSLPHLLAGAQLLLDRSGLEAGEPVDVQYAWVRDVRLVPGPGATVTVSGEKVLRVVSDPGHLSGWAAA